MVAVWYLTHPLFTVDATVPVPEWGSSEAECGRVIRPAERGAPNSIPTIVSSAVKKAIETAGPIAAALGLCVVVRAGVHENDRSATGYSPPDTFERTAP